MIDPKYKVGDRFVRRENGGGFYDFLQITSVEAIDGEPLYTCDGALEGDLCHGEEYDELVLNNLYVLAARPSTGEVTMVDPDTGGMKGQKPARFDLLPWGALEEIARHYGKGAEKYEDRNWEKGYDWSLSFAALQRHLTAWWTGEDIDAETGSSHLAAAAFHVLALMTFKETHPEKDNRPKR